MSEVSLLELAGSALLAVAVYLISPLFGSLYDFRFIVLFVIGTAIFYIFFLLFFLAISHNSEAVRLAKIKNKCAALSSQSPIDFLTSGVVKLYGVE